jgi:DNA-binding NtrC family response regulator
VLIYVVDDEPLLLDLISSVLHLSGHIVRSFADPVEAYDALMASEQSPDLIITDAVMRPISGVKLIQRIRRNRINCPVIFMSGYHGIGAMVNDSFGPLSVIEKPFTADILRKAVQKALPRNKTWSSHTV